LVPQTPYELDFEVERRFCSELAEVAVVETLDVVDFEQTADLVVGEAFAGGSEGYWVTGAVEASAAYVEQPYHLAQTAA
jgi:hypothetical protein